MRFVRILALMASVMLIVACVGCGEGEQTSAPKAPAPAAMQAPAGASEGTVATDANKVVAKSGDLAVTEGEVDELLARNLKYSMMMSGGKMPELTAQQKEQQRRNTIRNLMVSKLLLNEAKASGLTVTDKEIDEKLEQIYKMYGSKEKFLQSSGLSGTSDESLHEQMADTILREKYIEKDVYSHIPEPTEDEMQKWYDENKSKFSTPETVKVKTITVNVAEGASEADVAKAQERILSLAKRIKKGEAFDAVAKEASADRWAPKGGEMGLIRRGQARLGDKFDEAAFSAEVGKLTGPVRTTAGFCLLEATEKQPAKVKTYEEAKDQVKNWLPGLRKFKAMGEFMSKKKSELKIEYVGGEQQPL
ncbi:MAG TPA: peptidyl-prolyl cis-trans isomerase [bacterium]|nr:peptidyl-prolyl cis-trans isomerase [bacterium]